MNSREDVSRRLEQVPADGRSLSVKGGERPLSATHGRAEESLQTPFPYQCIARVGHPVRTMLRNLWHDLCLGV